jgi:hypothetical protein
VPGSVEDVFECKVCEEPGATASADISPGHRGAAGLVGVTCQQCTANLGRDAGDPTRLDG